MLAKPVPISSASQVTNVPSGDVEAINVQAAISELDTEKEAVANKSVDTALGTSDVLYPSQKAVKSYADSKLVGLLDYRGAYNASGNTYPASGGSGDAGAVLKGDMWVISVAGILSGAAIHIGDSLIANVDTPGQTAGNWNTLNANVAYVPEDQASKDASGGYAGLTALKLNLKNVLGTIINFFSTSSTAARTWTMPDKDGTVAMTSDITGANGYVFQTGGITLNGQIGVTVTHNKGDTSYLVKISPTGLTALGKVGDIAYVKSANTVVVYNSGQANLSADVELSAIA
ncbi:hypothetical protein A2V82_16585 [candidate division KSB1 bacterium RBG_16_48_16]|nr:MAG: hypothetical protein A2V82_16585 [candidate division KSB1 bacterium RBG_16_48_16]